MRLRCIKYNAEPQPWLYYLLQYQAVVSEGEYDPGGVDEDQHHAQADQPHRLRLLLLL
jgi:hypothetical protein